MKIQSPPGMRDLYPEDMRLQNWLFEAWRRTSRAFGFSEYEGPIFEFLELYTLKSGEAIVSELFTFRDRGERSFAIRPEMTPTLARMVAARANALPRPIKWFSIPRMCRAERPQRGRLREFYQWNVDILGVEDPLADAEVIAVAVEFFRDIGLTSEDVVIRVNSRPMASAALAKLGIPANEMETAFELIDRAERVSPAEFLETWKKTFPDLAPADWVLDVLSHAGIADCLSMVRATDAAGQAAADQTEELWERLRHFGIQQFCTFDLRIVRGLAYYTGIIYEAHARKGGLRALMGGGRYDDLTGLLNGPRVPGTGFGMGDAPVLEALRELGKVPDVPDALDIYVIDADHRLFADTLAVVTTLRRHRLLVDFSYKRLGVTKQFAQAAARRARYAIVVGDEYAARQELTVKNLSTGHQQVIPAARLLNDPIHALESI